jgi:HrpA-like RNA helicase
MFQLWKGGRALARMGAIDGDELTALGRHLAMIPADLRCGKLMVYGTTFGCLEACLTIAAILTMKSPLYRHKTSAMNRRLQNLLSLEGREISLVISEHTKSGQQ